MSYRILIVAEAKGAAPLFYSLNPERYTLQVCSCPLDFPALEKAFHPHIIFIDHHYFKQYGKVFLSFLAKKRIGLPVLILNECVNESRGAVHYIARKHLTSALVDGILGKEELTHEDKNSFFNNALG